MIAFLEEVQRRNIEMCIVPATDCYLGKTALERSGMKHFS